MHRCVRARAISMCTEINWLLRNQTLLSTISVSYKLDTFAEPILTIFTHADFRTKPRFRFHPRHEILQKIFNSDLSCALPELISSQTDTSNADFNLSPEILACLVTVYKAVTLPRKYRDLPLLCALNNSHRCYHPSFHASKHGKIVCCQRNTSFVLSMKDHSFAECFVRREKSLEILTTSQTQCNAPTRICRISVAPRRTRNTHFGFYYRGVNAACSIIT